eukprot:scaffold536_cov18-Tisochrysis_lutea.AAC.2
MAVAVQQRASAREECGRALAAGQNLDTSLASVGGGDRGGRAACGAQRGLLEEVVGAKGMAAARAGVEAERGLPRDAAGAVHLGEIRPTNSAPVAGAMPSRNLGEETTHSTHAAGAVPSLMASKLKCLKDDARTEGRAWKDVRQAESKWRRAQQVCMQVLVNVCIYEEGCGRTGMGDWADGDGFEASALRWAQRVCVPELMSMRTYAQGEGHEMHIMIICLLALMLFYGDVSSLVT